MADDALLLLLLLALLLPLPATLWESLADDEGAELHGELW